MVSTTCFMDLTKKAKIKGLTTTSWFIVIIGAFIAWFFFLTICNTHSSRDLLHIVYFRVF